VNFIEILSDELFEIINKKKHNHHTNKTHLDENTDPIDSNSLLNEYFPGINKEDLEVILKKMKNKKYSFKKVKNNNVFFF